MANRVAGAACRRPDIRAPVRRTVLGSTGRSLRRAMRRIGTPRHGNSPRRRRAGYRHYLPPAPRASAGLAMAEARPDNNRGPDSLRCKMALDAGPLILAYRRTRPMVAGAWY